MAPLVPLHLHVPNFWRTLSVQWSLTILRFTFCNITSVDFFFSVQPSFFLTGQFCILVEPLWCATSVLSKIKGSECSGTDFQCQIWMSKPVFPGYCKDFSSYWTFPPKCSSIEWWNLSEIALKQTNSWCTVERQNLRLQVKTNVQYVETKQTRTMGKTCLDYKQKP